MNNKLLQKFLKHENSNSRNHTYDCEYINGITSKIEKGIITSDNMASFSLGSETYKYYDLIFSKQYTTPPNVQVSLYNNNRTNYGLEKVGVGNITTTGCTLILSVNISNENYGVSYLVIGDN